MQMSEPNLRADQLFAAEQARAQEAETALADGVDAALSRTGQNQALADVRFGGKRAVQMGDAQAENDGANLRTVRAEIASLFGTTFIRNLIASTALGGAAAFRAAIAALGALDIAPLVSGARGWAGYTPELLSSQRAGRATDRAPLAFGTVVEDDILGLALAVDGREIPADPGYLDVALREDVPLGLADKTALHWTLRRSIAPVDPAGEGVELWIEQLDAAGVSLGKSRVGGARDPQVGDAPIDVTWVVSRSAGTGVDQVVWANTRSVTPFIRLYGQTGRIAISRLDAAPYAEQIEGDFGDQLEAIEESSAALLASAQAAQAAAAAALASAAAFALVAPDVSPTGTDQTVAIQVALNAAIAAGKRFFTFAPGRYLISKAAAAVGAVALLTAANASGLTIRGQGATLVQTIDPANLTTTVTTTLLLQDCVDFGIEGLTADYSSAINSEGVITAVDTMSIAYTPDAGRAPLTGSMDYFFVLDGVTGKPKARQYALAANDYAPDGSYALNPLDGQALGQPGRYGFTPPSITSLVSAIVATSPLTVTALNHGQPDGTTVTITGLKDASGNPALVGVPLLVSVVDANTLTFLLDEDTTADLAGATLAAGASISTVRIPAGVSVGDRIWVLSRKRIISPVLIFRCTRLTLGTASAPFTVAQAFSSAIAGCDLDTVKGNLVFEKPGSSIAIHGGGWAVDGVRGERDLTMFARGTGDDLDNAVVRYFSKSYATAPVVGATTITIDTATDAKSGRAILACKGDLLEWWNMATSTLVATTRITDITAVPGTPGRYTYTLSGAVPVGFTVADWAIINRSGVAVDTLRLTHIGGMGRTMIAQNRIRSVEIYGENVFSSLFKAHFPNSAVHYVSGGGGTNNRTGRIRIYGKNVSSAYTALACAAVSLRRFIPPKTPVSSPSDWVYPFEVINIDGYDFCALNASGVNATVEQCVLRNGGRMRATDPRTAAGQDVVGNYDIRSEQGTVRIDVDDFDTGQAFAFKEDTGGQLYQPLGSMLRSAGTLAAGATTITAAKKVRAGQEARVRVLVGGVEQDPSTYTANGTTTLTFASAPYAVGGPVPYSVIHVRC